jgi:hypothetical protein
MIRQPRQPRQTWNPTHDDDLRNAMDGISGPMDGARAVVVNRTHRVVRDQALAMRERRQRSRDLFAPLAICSVLLLVICYAIWGVLDGYDLTPNGVPDASDQLSLLLLWSLPVTALVLGLVWFKRGRRAGGGSEAQQ